MYAEAFSSQSVKADPEQSWLWVFVKGSDCNGADSVCQTVGLLLFLGVEAIHDAGEVGVEQLVPVGCHQHGQLSWPLSSALS